jgi:hypothetical protein
MVLLLLLVLLSPLLSPLLPPLLPLPLVKQPLVGPSAQEKMKRPPQPQ